MTIKELLDALNVIEAAKNDVFPKLWTSTPRAKFTALDIGGSGAFMIENATGEIYNIKGYGVPDRNKKLKADIGNLATVDPAYLHAHRFNYLR